MAQYTELQQYRMNYIRDRKDRIIKRLEEIHTEASEPGILFEDHEKLMTEKNDLVAEFDNLSDEYREIVQAKQLYRYYLTKAYILKKKWGLTNETE